MKPGSRMAGLIAVSPSLRAGCAATGPQTAASPDPKQAKITVTYGTFGKTSGMKKDWGFAAIFEYGGKRTLFATGNDAEVFAHNVKAKGIDLTKLDFVVMSHCHGDRRGRPESPPERQSGWAQ